MNIVSIAYSKHLIIISLKIIEKMKCQKKKIELNESFH